MPVPQNAVSLVAIGVFVVRLARESPPRKSRVFLLLLPLSRQGLFYRLNNPCETLPDLKYAAQQLSASLTLSWAFMPFPQAFIRVFECVHASGVKPTLFHFLEISFTHSKGDSSANLSQASVNPLKSNSTSS